MIQIEGLVGRITEWRCVRVPVHKEGPKTPRTKNIRTGCCDALRSIPLSLWWRSLATCLLLLGSPYYKENAARRERESALWEAYCPASMAVCGLLSADGSGVFLQRGAN